MRLFDNTPELDRHEELMAMLRKIVKNLNTLNKGLEQYFEFQYKLNEVRCDQAIVDEIKDILK